MNNKKMFYSITLVLSLFLLGTINSTAQTIRDIEKQEKLERQRIEKLNYENALSIGTLSAYKEYLKMYPNGSYKNEINNLIADYELWDQARLTNTIDAYNNYIKKTKQKRYITEARMGINELESKAEWQSVRNNGNIKEIERFVNMFPSSSYITNAREKIHELKAVDFYNSGEYIKAYNEFIKVDKNKLDRTNQEIYDKSVEYYNYSQLSNNSKEGALLYFLKRYPRSQYYNVVSNMLAVNKAKRMGMYSSESSYKEALSYATDRNTRNIVYSYIQKSKDAYKEQKKLERRARIRSNGGYINFGAEPLDFGYNKLIDDRTIDINYYNVGVCFRIGNYKSPVQLEFGVKPGIIVWDNYTEYDGYYDEYGNYYDQYSDYYSGFQNNYYNEYGTQRKFHMPLYSKLKVNLFNGGRYSKVYIGGLFSYNVVRNDNIENEYSVGGGAGIAWRHWDWFLYYKQDIEENYNANTKYAGISIGYYF